MQSLIFNNVLGKSNHFSTAQSLPSSFPPQDHFFFCEHYSVTDEKHAHKMEMVLQRRIPKLCVTTRQKWEQVSLDSCYHFSRAENICSGVLEKMALQDCVHDQCHHKVNT